MFESLPEQTCLQYAEDGNCDFYTGCLEDKYSCGTKGYPVGYGHRYCTRFSTYYNEFNDEGKAWIDDVRRCLMSALVPIYKSNSYSCDEVKTLAFTSHPTCYTESGDRFCKVFWSNKLALLKVFEADDFLGEDSALAIEQILMTGLQCLCDYGVADEIHRVVDATSEVWTKVLDFTTQLWRDDPEEACRTGQGGLGQPGAVTNFWDDRPAGVCAAKCVGTARTPFPAKDGQGRRRTGRDGVGRAGTASDGQGRRPDSFIFTKVHFGQAVQADCEAKALQGDCDFYNCLERRHPCGLKGFASREGRTLCEALKKKKGLFNAQGQAWVTDFTKCLTRSLLPKYREESISCRHIHNFGYRAQDSCFIDTGICDLVEDNQVWTYKSGTEPKPLDLNPDLNLNNEFALWYISNDVEDSRFQLELSTILCRCNKYEGGSRYRLKYSSELGIHLKQKAPVVPTPVLGVLAKSAAPGMSNLEDSRTNLEKKRGSNSSPADLPCTSQGGTCQDYTVRTCLAGYETNKCGGNALRRCCLQCDSTCQSNHQTWSAGDSSCSNAGGQCKMDSNFCHGQYRTGMCGGPAGRTCCVPGPGGSSSGSAGDSGSTGSGHGNYGNIMNVDTTGASERTARQDENAKHLIGVPASQQLARNDLSRLNNYKSQIDEAAADKNMDPAIIAAIISRESRAGNVLDANGWGDHGNGFGLMQVDRRYHTPVGGPYSTEHMKQATQILIDTINCVKNEHSDWTAEMALKGGISGYNAGCDNVQTYEGMDVGTTFDDYANDVVARAQWLRGQGFGQGTADSSCTVRPYSNTRFVGDPIHVEDGFRGSMDTINTAAAECNVKVYITHSWRKVGEIIPGAIVTPASRSNHFVGHAIDMNVQRPDESLCNSSCLRGQSDSDATCFIGKVRAAGLTWGGVWSTPDPVHIDDRLNQNTAVYDTMKCKPLTNKNKANITIPYVQGVSEKLRRIFQNFNIATNFKPHSTLRQRLVHPKDRPHKGTKANVIYRLKCEEPNCNNTYIGETSRPLKVRYKEHCRPSANGYSSAIFHHLQHNQGHSFKLESTDILDRETRWWERGVKEAIYERMYNPTLNREGGLRVDLSGTWDLALPAPRTDNT
ncbi:hypothetical protein Bbelb_087170 [Branchiostoma belcheri]|nr:hypothetical protein Bbelb_087170 [Branchiostoma belcheri]